MPVTNQSVFDTASTVFHELAEEIFSNADEGEFSTFADLQPTDVEVNTYDVLEAMPIVREWVGPKQYPNVHAASASLTMKGWESSFSIKRRKFIGDRTGRTARAISQWLRGVDIRDQIATDVLVSASGAGPTGYDGQPIFSASHPRGPAAATQSNITTSALSFANHKAIKIAMTSLRDAHGRSLRISPDTLMVGPKNVDLAREITESKERIISVAADGLEAGTRVAAAAIPNVYAGGDMRVVMNPRLVGTYDDYCYYLDTTKGARVIGGFVMRSEEAQEQTDMSSSARFENDEFRFSVEADLVFGAGAWHVGHAIIL